MDFSSISWDRDGAGIEQESFRRIEAECPPETIRRFSPEEWRVARRLIHTGADFSLADLLEFRNGAVSAGLRALREGRLIYTDSNMIKAGLSVAKLQKLHPDYTRDSILCPVADPAVAAYAKERNITRALAAVELHAESFRNAVFLCGNAPLALAGVVRLYAEKKIRPALVIAMPVGFVNVTESKKLLDGLDFPWIRMNGRRGGSPFAVAALHGILESGLS